MLKLCRYEGVLVSSHIKYAYLNLSHLDLHKMILFMHTILVLVALFLLTTRKPNVWSLLENIFISFRLCLYFI
jgi:hypothetical protein